ncbi:MAG: chromosome segregation protein SMC [Lewinellaceae bacterium]|nr:chromosome segregation protein SMC [Saprospiraceae bacterium]MCB9342137.1 chromosome segregation protein SMC [Lewinellaceae bacterium]
MRLKSLEIKGFKSFANDTVLHFNEDVTGVVGPNGSGKSNVVDSIRWVLGEQKSSQLRLDKMASVIFNGTKKKKEGQMAQVTLTFDNTKNVLPTEYTTVSISRILYRSGESEYRLNGISCRLKDITSLFLDTGIGPDSYAIIALNMVEDLLSDREQARRKMFEQAAGVSKYKARKHETKQKLEATAADLDRVEDLLFEITDQLKKLEKQAERAQRYYELKNEYKNSSIELAVHNLARHKKTYQELESQIAREEDNYRSTEAMARMLEADIEAKRKSHTDKETSLSEQQQEANRLTGRIRGKENEKAMLEQKCSFINNDILRLQDQIALNTNTSHSLASEIEGYSTDLNYEKNVEAEFEEGLNTAQKDLESVRSNHNLLKGNLDEFIKDQQSLEREIVEFEKTKAIQINQIENLRNDVERTMGDIASRREEMKVLETKIQEQSKAESIQSEKISKLTESEAKRKAEISDAESKQETLVKKLSDHNRILDARRNEFKLTKSMVESLEGFPESIKFLSQDKDWAKRCPLLSDLVFVKEEYRIVIENYLENYLNYYVVPNAEEAMKAIGLLGKSQKGRANFFMLDAFDNYSPPLTLLPGGIRAVELIEVEAQYRPLFEYLLENVVITEEASPNAPAGSDLILLSKSGTFVKRKFSMSGGSVGLFEGKKIGRKKNLENLEQEIKKFEGTETKLNAELGIIKTHLLSLKNADQSVVLQQEREAHNRLSQELAGMQAKLDNIAAFVSNFDAQAGDANQRIRSLTENNAKIEEQLKTKTAAAEALRNKLENADGSFRDVAEQLSQASAAYNQRNIEFIRQQNKVNTLQQELSFRENRRRDLNEALNNAQTNLAKNIDELGLLEADIQRITEELTAAYAEKKEKEAALSGVEQSYFKARNEIHELENKQRDNFRKQQDLQSLVNRLKEKFSDVKFEITSIGERLRAEFGIGVNDIINQEPNEQYNRETLEREVNNLKRRLDTYGEINPMAIEAFNEIKERHDTIAAQRDDINNAKENLLLTMKEIEETATARFLDSFAQVRENFISVFRTLFTEDDSADLLLSNPDNPLESDINIIAKPKGKRPQTIAQLSGGEKTLTATALLFALYLLKPAPFCIFDEVDAPLDDANIEKFNRIIRQFSKDSQFIVVTHNKATMAAVDTIYGVYMPEQGVSSVTQVDFRKLDHEAMVFEG